MATENKCVDLVVPIAVVVNDKTLDDPMNKLWADKNKMVGPLFALRAMLKTLCGLVERQDPLLKDCEFDSFVHALNSCHIGFVKEACGLSSSASVGCAQAMFEKYGPTQDEVGLVFNFGTGGGKATGFTQVDGVLKLLFDVKPGEYAPSPNDMPFGPYEPTTPKDAAKDLQDFQLFCIEIQKELATRSVSWINIFVTGPVREKYCGLIGGSDDEKYMILTLTEYMHPIRETWPQAKCDQPIFLPQETEAEYENKACDALYTALSNTQDAADYKVVPGSSCGIGRGSCQAFLGFMAGVGMKHLETDNLPEQWMFDAMLKHLHTDAGRKAINDFVRNVHQIVASGYVPIIPCKSGFALLMNHDKGGQKMMSEGFAATVAELHHRKVMEMQEHLNKLHDLIRELEDDLLKPPSKKPRK